MLAKFIQERMDHLCAEGDRLLDIGVFDQALASYEAAASLIPEPKLEWEAATWIYRAIGDCCFFKGDFSNALRAFQTAVTSPGGLGNPYIHLRLGQCHLELGNSEKAADELTRAYMGHGKEIFDSEDEKYLGFLSTRIQME